MNINLIINRKKIFVIYLIFFIILICFEFKTLNNIKIKTNIIYKHIRKIFWPTLYQNNYTIYLKSKCDCRKQLLIRIDKNNVTSIHSETSNQNWTHLYDIKNSEKANLNFTCNLYNSLRRGRSQKVIGFSLYNKNEIYYNKLKEISLQLKRFYPDWIMRSFYYFYFE